MKLRNLILMILTMVFVIFLSGCGNEDSIPGTYISDDEDQTIVLQSDHKVLYSEESSSDSSTGTWEIKDNILYVDRITTNGEIRQQIYAEVPSEGEIDYLYFKANPNSPGEGHFFEGLFRKVSSSR